MTLLVIILIALAVWVVFLVVMGLIFEPRSIINIAVGPFWVLSHVVTEFNEFVVKSSGVLQAFWNLHITQIRKLGERPDPANAPNVPNTFNAPNAPNVSNTDITQVPSQPLTPVYPTPTPTAPAYPTGNIQPGAGRNASAPKNPDSNVAVWFVSRVFYLLIALALIVTTGSLDIQRATTAQFGTRTDTFTLPGLLGSASFLNGLIWITMIMFWGVITLDVFDITPHYARLIHIEGKWTTRIFRLIILVSDVFLIVTVSAVYYTASINANNPTPWVAAENVISLAQGALINFAGFLALLAVIFGASVFVILGAGILIILLSLLHIVTGGLEKLCDVIADGVERIFGIHANVSRATIQGLRLSKFGPTNFPRVNIDENGVVNDPYEEALYSPYRTSVTPQSSKSSSSSDATSRYGAVENASYPTFGRDTQTTPQVDVGRTIALAVGNSAIDYLHYTLNDVATFKGDKLVNGVGYLGDWTQKGEPGRKFEMPFKGVVDLSPSNNRVLYAHSISAKPDEMRELLIDDMFQNVINFCQSERPSRGQILLYVTFDSIPRVAKAHNPRYARNMRYQFQTSPSSGLAQQNGQNGYDGYNEQYSDNEQTLNLLKQLHLALPEYPISVIAIRPRFQGPALNDISVALESLVNSHNGHTGNLITSALLVDALSPLAGTEGEFQQRSLVVRSLASLICAPATDSDNGTVNMVFNLLGDEGYGAPFITAGIQSRRISSGPQSPVGRFLNSFGMPRRGASSEDNIRDTVRQIFTNLLDELSGWTAAYNAPLQPGNTQMVAVVTIPMSPTDRRWKNLVELITADLQTISSVQTTPVYIQGNGVPDSTRLPREYYAQVAVLVGLDDVQPDQNGGALGGIPHY